MPTSLKPWMIPNIAAVSGEDVSTLVSLLHEENLNHREGSTNEIKGDERRGGERNL